MRLSKWMQHADGGSDYWTWVRHVRDRIYHVLKVEDLSDNFREEEKGPGFEKWYATLSEVDLDTVDTKAVLAQFQEEDRGFEDPVLAELCADYGSAAPMWFEQGKSFAALKSTGMGESRQLCEDASHREAQLDRPVNMIGTTAREFGRPNGIRESLDRLDRQRQQGEAAIKEAAEQRRQDPLAWDFGYMDGFRNKPMPTRRHAGGALAVAYKQGHAYGTLVHRGERPEVPWAKRTGPDSWSLEHGPPTRDQRSIVDRMMNPTKGS